MSIPSHIQFDGFFMSWWIDEGMPTENLSSEAYGVLLIAHRAYSAARETFGDSA